MEGSREGGGTFSGSVGVTSSSSSKIPLNLEEDVVSSSSSSSKTPSKLEEAAVD